MFIEHASIMLENLVEGDKYMQAIDLDSVMKKYVGTLLVMSGFFIAPGRSRD